MVASCSAFHECAGGAGEIGRYVVDLKRILRNIISPAHGEGGITAAEREHEGNICDTGVNGIILKSTPHKRAWYRLVCSQYEATLS